MVGTRYKTADPACHRVTLRLTKKRPVDEGAEAWPRPDAEAPVRGAGGGTVEAPARYSPMTMSWVGMVTGLGDARRGR